MKNKLTRQAIDFFSKDHGSMTFLLIIIVSLLLLQLRSLFSVM